MYCMLCVNVCDEILMGVCNQWCVLVAGRAKFGFSLDSQQWLSVSQSVSQCTVHKRQWPCLSKPQHLIAFRLSGEWEVVWWAMFTLHLLVLKVAN